MLLYHIYYYAFRGIKVSLQYVTTGKIVIQESENNDPETYIDKAATQLNQIIDKRFICTHARRKKLMERKETE